MIATDYRATRVLAAYEPTASRGMTLARPFDLHGRELYRSASVGIAIDPHDQGTTQQLVRNADLAL